jgi:hypothetical protein
MAAWQIVTWRAAVVGRWMALIVGTLAILFFLAFFFGEGPPRFSELTAAERLQFLAIGAMLLGLAAAWKSEGAGGLIALAGFMALVWIDTSHLKLPIFDFAAAVGLVHVLCGGRLHAGPPAGITPWHTSRSIAFALVAVLVIFVLLCANEMFGQPPLMTPSLHPSPTLTGAWTQTGTVDVILKIHPDASVTGTLDRVTITDARVMYGRSWFGKLLHWNADYVIRGRISGHEFAAPLMARPHALDGSLFRDGRPTSLNLRRL